MSEIHMNYQAVGHQKGRRIESPVFEGPNAQTAAISWAHQNLKGCNSKQLLKEHDKTINAGKLFLDRFLTF